MANNHGGFDSLREYALWYYFKYLCSKKRLFAKVFAKSGKDEVLTQQVLDDISEYIDEEKNVEARVRFCIERNKNIRYIQGNLVSKGYDSVVVKKYISIALEERGGSVLNAESIGRKILSYKEKGKSKKYILQKLLEREDDRALIHEQLDKVFAEGDDENIKKEYAKIAGKFETKKIIEKLLRKGFSYDDIKKTLS